MFKYYLETIDGISIYPLFSFVIFFLFFILMGVWVIRVNKDYLKTMSAIPLDESTQDKIINEN